MATKEICDSCLRGDQEIQAKSWCTDCEEKLCDACDKAHRVGKLTLLHSLNELKDLPLVHKNIVLETEMCENHQKPLDFYCTFHDMLCCRGCMPESHRTCEKVDAVDDICNDIRSSAFFENLSETVSDVLKTSNLIVENRNQNIETINQQHKNIQARITSIKSDINLFADTFEETLLSQTKVMHDLTASNLKEEARVMEKTSQRLKGMTQELDFISKYGSNKRLFLFAQKLRQKLITEDAHVEDMLSKMNNVTLNLTEDDMLYKITSNLAEVSVETSPITIKHTPFTQKCVQSVPSLLSFVPAEPIDLSRFGNLAISAIEILVNGNLLICDCDERYVLLYKDDGTFLRKNQLNGRPCQIAVLHNENQAAITIFVETRIIIINTSSLQIVRQIKTDRHFYGLLSISDNLCMLGGGMEEMDLLNENGVVFGRVVTTSNPNFVRFIKKQNERIILYTDSRHMFGIDRLNKKEVFRYTGNTEARGIAQDKNGYIYIADKYQNNVHRLAPDGSFVDIVLDKMSGITKSLAITFNQDGNRFYVGSTESKIFVFDCN